MQICQSTGRASGTLFTDSYAFFVSASGVAFLSGSNQSFLNLKLLQIALFCLGKLKCFKKELSFFVKRSEPILLLVIVRHRLRLYLCEGCVCARRTFCILRDVQAVHPMCLHCGHTFGVVRVSISLSIYIYTPQ